MIKKIEHFWKGLTNDKTQISALPPDLYGDRFYNFIEGNTMSTEEAHILLHRHTLDHQEWRGAKAKRHQPQRSQLVVP